jgi:phospholipid-transporting ATPase
MIALTLCVQICLAMIGATIGATWNLGAGADASYMGADSTKQENGFGYYFIKQTGTWILIFTNFVPISLMVTLELVKFW